jgi:hypothetical protein
MSEVAPAVPDCFVIMPIGRPETELVWTEVYKPTIEACSFKPCRVDKEDDGRQLPTQIIQFLQLSPLLIADLTFARPNCYYEIGFAMGLNRERNVILCCREDHNSDSPRFVASQNKVHFDIHSYGILWWDPENLESFRQELRSKIKLRKKVLEREAARLNRAIPQVSAGPMSLDRVTDLEAKLKRLAEREERVAATWKKRS